MTGRTQTEARAPIALTDSQRAQIRQFDPEVVLGVAYTSDGLAQMREVMSTVRGTPAILWLLDLQLHPTADGRVPAFEQLLPGLTEVWALSPQMIEWLSAMAQWPASVRKITMPHWCVEMATMPP